MNKKLLIYGLGGPEKAYQCLEYYCIFDTDRVERLLDEVDRIAMRLKVKNPSIRQIFAIHDRYGLRRDFQDSIRGASIESFMIFRDILEREGHEIHLK